jgi:hypothetical protein
MSAAYPYHHAPPPPGVHQPGEGQPRATAQAGGFINVNARLYAPLQGLNPDNILEGGYDWLSLTDGGATLHPGLDLNSGTSCNSDEGLLCVAPLAGVVRAALWWDGVTSGEGNHVWIELDDPCCPAPTFLHNDHLQTILVNVGQRLTPGEPYGRCGRTGNWDCAHAHVELSQGAPTGGWWQWPYRWSRSQVEAAYYNPYWWWQAATSLVLAEANGGPTPPPEVIVSILSGAQTAAVEAAMFGDYWADTNPDFAIPTAWRERWQSGHWPGRAITAEQDIPPDDSAGKPAGKMQLFEYGCAVWLPGEDVSWDG